MSERDARQFVVRVLDVAQGAGALVQVDDEPPRWLSTSDALAVDVPVSSPSQDERRTPIAAGWGRERSTVWACPRCEQRHVLTGDTWLDCVCGARYRFVYGDEPEADAPERWIGWSEGEMRRIRAAMSSLAAEEGLGDLAEEFSSAVDREYARREEAKAPDLPRGDRRAAGGRALRGDDR